MIVLRRVEDRARLAYLVWEFAEPLMTASTASVGGGVGPRTWVVNAQVANGYDRHDLAAHADELAAAAGLVGPGVTMLTAADVTRYGTAADGGVNATATVGITHPTWAAAADPVQAAAVGTINIVVEVPVALSSAALLGALCTATEAKTQALLEHGVPGTGTPSDAVTVVCPAGVAPGEPFCGVRSDWGSRLARAVHAAVSLPLVRDRL